MGDADGLALNWYGPSTMMAAKAGDVAVRIRQNTDYPRGRRGDPRRAGARGGVHAEAAHPALVAGDAVEVNDRRVPNVAHGQVPARAQTWHAGDQVIIDLDMGPSYWAGERECAGEASLYHGPLLLAYKPVGTEQPPTLDVSSLLTRSVPARPDAMFLFDVRDRAGTTLRLRDYGTAGADRHPYVTWIPAKNARVTPFSRENPTRTAPIPLPAR